MKAAAFYNLANAFFKKDKFKESIEAYQRALALDPKDERAKWNLEIALKKKRDEDKKKEQNKDKKDDKDKNDKKDDKDKKKDDDKQDKSKKDDKDKQDDHKQQNEDRPEEKPAAQRDMESVLDSLEKSPKDLEKQRAALRAVRRAPPTRDW